LHRGSTIALAKKRENSVENIEKAIGFGSAGYAQKGSSWLMAGSSKSVNKIRKTLEERS